MVAWYAPTDLAALPGDLGADPMAADSREAQLLGAPRAARAGARRARPARSPTSAPARRRSCCCTARADRLVPCAQSERLHDALRRAGADGRAGTYTGADHMWRGAPGAAEQALDRTVDFLLAALAG